MNAQYKRWVELVATLLVVVGALNWGLVGLGALLGTSGWNLVEMLLGSMPSLVNLVYLLVGLSGVWMLLGKLNKK